MKAWLFKLSKIVGMMKLGDDHMNVVAEACEGKDGPLKLKSY